MQNYSNIKDIEAFIYKNAQNEKAELKYSIMMDRGYANASEKKSIKENPLDFMEETKKYFFTPEFTKSYINKLREKFNKITDIFNILKQLITLKTKKFMEIFLKCDEKNKIFSKEKEINELINTLEKKELIETSDEKEKELIKKLFNKEKENAL